jgi:hypothetical protein
MPSLWRNGVLLGRIVDRPEKRGSNSFQVYGQLKPTPAAADLQPMMQTRSPMLPHKPTFQVATEKEVFANTSTGNHARSVVEIGEKDAQPAEGVPADQLLEIRADDGTVLDVDFVWLHCSIIPDEIPIAEIQRQLGTTDDTREAWWVAAHRFDEMHTGAHWPTLPFPQPG